MPAGKHDVLDQAQDAVEQRARAILAQLQELGKDSVKGIDNEGTAVAEEECSSLG
jgi:hypothetical protein